MKATGIVRRIDDLGRIVIPKEIRRTLRIRETDALEIFTDKEGEIILKKYSTMGELEELARQYAESLAKTTGLTVCITDMDQIIAAAGNGKKDYMQKSVSTELEDVINNRDKVLSTEKDTALIPLTQDEKDDKMHFLSETVSPIISGGDVLGAVVIVSADDKSKVSQTELRLAEVAADFLGRQMES